MKAMPISYFRPIWLLALLCFFGPAAAQATHEVKIRVPIPGDTFTPNDLTIEVGDTVVWRTVVIPYLSNFHNVTADKSSFASPTALEFEFSHTFTKAGEILYHCSKHSSPGRDRDQFENGRIIVQGGNGGSASNLALQRVHAASGTYKPGDAIPIDITIENAGGQASPAYNVTYYASADALIKPSDWKLGTDSRPSLQAGQTSNFAGNATLPANIPYSYYFIGAKINISDANNTNNVSISDVGVYVAFQINIGLNDTWRNKDTRGQGFFINVFPDTSPERPEPVMFVGWFTFDLERPSQGVTALLGEPGHRWLTAYGPYSGDTATLDIELTQGGIFDSSIPVPTQTPAYGTMTVQFTSCSEGVVSYDIPSVGVSGTVPIERVTNDNVALCESLQNP